MRFFRIRLRVREIFEEKTYSPQEIVGAKDEETAIALAKAEWEGDHEILEVRSCDEVFPESVICERIVYWSRAIDGLSV
jgi:hypothetical protein